jgi:hypothetical protein
MTQLRVRKKNVEVVNIRLSQKQYEKLQKMAAENGFSSAAILLDDIVHSYLNKHYIRLSKTAHEYEKSVVMPVQISRRNWYVLDNYSKETKISKTSFLHIVLREITKKIKDL